MTATPTAGYVAGLWEVQYWMRDANGYPKGTQSSPDSVANGTEMHAGRLNSPVSATLPAPTRDIAIFRGKSVVKGQLALGVSDYGSFEITDAAFHETVHALSTGTSADVTTASDHVIMQYGATVADLPQMGIMLSQTFQDITGTNYYLHYLFGSCQIFSRPPGATQEGGVNPNPTTYQVTPTATTRTPLGLLFSDLATNGPDTDIALIIRSPGKMALSSYVHDNSDTSFLVGYRPTSSENAGVRNIFTNAGSIAHTQVSAVNTTTGAVTITAQTAASIWVAFYQTNFVAI